MFMYCIGTRRMMRDEMTQIVNMLRNMLRKSQIRKQLCNPQQSGERTREA